MRIIKSAWKDHEIKIQCHNCNSILGVTSGDIRYDSAKKAHCIKCAVCNEYVGVPAPEELFPWKTEEGVVNNEEIPSSDSVRKYEV